MEDINYLDILVIALVAILGFKGILNGLVKEFFGLFGIVGGVYVASRYSDSLSLAIESLYLFENKTATLLAGFVVILVLFWIGALIVGKIVSKLVELSALSAIDKIFGFIFGAGKIFLIFSIIIYTLSNIEVVRKNIDQFTENSITYPLLLEFGGMIVKLEESSGIISLPMSEDNITK